MLKSGPEGSVVHTVTSARPPAAPDPGAGHALELARSAIAVLVDEETEPTTPRDWLRFGNASRLVRDGGKLDARLRAADTARPPLLLVYGEGSDLVRAAATITGLRAVGGGFWVFELGRLEPGLEGRSVTFAGQPVRRQRLATYYGPAGPGRAAFLAGLAPAADSPGR